MDTNIIEIKEGESIFMDINEVKKLLSLSTSSVYKFVHEYNIPYLRTGTKYKIYRKGLYDFIDKKLKSFENDTKSIDSSSIFKIMEIIDAKHDDVLFLMVDNVSRVLELNVKKGTKSKVMSDSNVNNILNYYKNLNYKIRTNESDDESSINFLDNSIMNEFKKVYR